MLFKFSSAALEYLSFNQVKDNTILKLTLFMRDGIDVKLRPLTLLAI